MEEEPIILDKFPWGVDDKYPMILYYNNFTLCFSTVNWLTTADEIYKFLTRKLRYHNLMMQNLQIKRTRKLM